MPAFVPTYRTPGECTLANLFDQRHAFGALISGGVSVPKVVTPSPGKRIVVQTMFCRSNNAGEWIDVTCPGCETVVVESFFNVLSANFWNGWPAFVGAVDQPVTVEIEAGFTSTWCDVHLGYFEV